jgi:hypothetical protein
MDHFDDSAQMDFNGSQSGHHGARTANSVVPLFLLKTYSILNTAPEEIVGWSDDGDSFLVHDVERFSEEVIPSHFKHSKFTSFVRQLNFYGFRKVKGRLNSSNKSEQHAWEFRHPFFQRGKPHLLGEIKRSNGPADEEPQPVSNSTESVIEALQRQIAELNGKVNSLTHTVQDLQEVLEGYRRIECRNWIPTAVIPPAPVEYVPTREYAPAAVFTSDTNSEPSLSDAGAGGHLFSSEPSWELDDADELMKALSEDLNFGEFTSLNSVDRVVADPMKAPMNNAVAGGALKRQRSIDEFSRTVRQAPAPSFVPQIEGSAFEKVYNPNVMANMIAAAAATNAVAATAMASPTLEQCAAAITALLSCSNYQGSFTFNIPPKVSSSTS